MIRCLTDLRRELESGAPDGRWVNGDFDRAYHLLRFKDDLDLDVLIVRATDSGAVLSAEEHLGEREGRHRSNHVTSEVPGRMRERPAP